LICAFSIFCCKMTNPNNNHQFSYELQIIRPKRKEWLMRLFLFLTNFQTFPCLKITNDHNWRHFRHLSKFLFQNPWKFWLLKRGRPKIYDLSDIILNNKFLVNLGRHCNCWIVVQVFNFMWKRLSTCLSNFEWASRTSRVFASIERLFEYA
jgi:hypothetical protein